jgi:hypothetical protein
MPMKKHASLGFVHLVPLVLITIVGVGVLGYYAFKSGQIKMPVEQTSSFSTSQQDSSSSPTQIVEKSSTPTSNPTADWKIYSNNAYGFSLRYPPSWTIDTDDQNYIRLKSPNQTPEGQEPNAGALFEIETNKSDDPVTLDELQAFTKSTDTLQVTSKTESVIQGKPAIFYKAKDLTSAEIEGANVGLSNGFLRILMKNYGKKSADKQTLQQILSTFKFIGQ